MALRILAYILIFSICILIIAMHININDSFGSYWFGGHSDPDYAYLLNSLNVATLHYSGHFDHPGTTLHILGAIIVRITHFFYARNVSLIDSVLINPEYYLHTINNLLFCLYILVFLSVSTYIWLVYKDIFLLFCILSSLFLNFVQIHSLSRVSPELLMPMLSLLLTALILKRYNELRVAEDCNKKLPLLGGALAATCFCTKVTMIPICSTIFFLWSEAKDRKKNLIVFLCSFGVFLLQGTNYYIKEFNEFFESIQQIQEITPGEIISLVKIK